MLPLSGIAVDVLGGGTTMHVVEGCGDRLCVWDDGGTSSGTGSGGAVGRDGKVSILGIELLRKELGGKHREYVEFFVTVLLVFNFNPLVSISVVGVVALVASAVAFFVNGVPFPLGKSGNASVISERAAAAVVGFSFSMFANRLH